MIAKESITRGLSVLLVIALAIAVRPHQTAHAVAVLHAAPTASGAGDCKGWDNACTLQYALTIASGWEIWVAAGTHTPATEEKDPRKATFQLKDGVAVYGGFAMTETLRSQRNPAANVTIMSGDIGKPDDSSDNSYHVVTGATGATLDGFTITAGNANGAYPNERGGAMYNDSSSPAVTNLTFFSNTAATGGGGMANNASSPILTNVTFSGNSAAAFGGGMANWSGSGPALTNATFVSNSASFGGGMYNYYNNAIATLTNVTFDSNWATLGGGMYSEDSSGPAIMNVTFRSNSATSSGGGMYNSGTSPTLMNATFSGNSADSGGGMGNQSNSRPVLTNVTFISNTATTQGGAMYDYSSSPALTNVTFSGNAAVYFGGGMANRNNSSPTIRNTIFWGNTAPSGAQVYNDSSTPIVSDSVVEGGCPTGSNCTTFIITTTPLLGTLGNYGGATQTVPLLAGSSAINGTATNCPASDQRGVPRSNPICDIGAYEVQTILLAVPGGQTGGLCEGWTNACELRYALTSAVSGQEIWAATGVYTPTAGADRAATFQLKAGVALYGGFAGAETARTQRNPAANVTILSGDIGTRGDSSDNSYHVVTGATGATLDGFTITAGNANGACFSNCIGGGMYNSSGGSPTLTNVFVSGNSAQYGGGVGNQNLSSPMLSYVTFNGNSAADRGGGMYNLNTSSPALTNVTFISNSAAYGGGMYDLNYSSPTLTNVTFSGNTAGKGGGMYNLNWSSPSLANVTFSGNTAGYGGGMFSHYYSNPTFTNVTFSSNAATISGGGIHNESESLPALTNVTFSGNSAPYGGGMFSQWSSSPAISNTIFWGNTATSAGAQIQADGTSIPSLSDSVVEGGFPGGTNIITTTPRLGTLGDYGGWTQTIPLQAGSSAIDTGNDVACPATDQRGVIRPQGAHCDIGAFEKQVYSIYLPLILKNY
jgi:hypothetical protein